MKDESSISAESDAVRDSFSRLDRAAKIDRLAAIIYADVHVLPYGFPSPFPTWKELPEIDSGHRLGVDKLRYKNAASAVYDLLTAKDSALLGRLNRLWDKLEKEGRYTDANTVFLAKQALIGMDDGSDGRNAE